MKIVTAEFAGSSPNISKCPKTDIPEFAFIGRSNVGKSSLINLLCDRKKLAKTSSTPGKTQLINHFMINDSWYLVDLPGYGYAKISKSTRAKWKKMIDEYLVKRENLVCVFVLVDIRIKPQKLDLEFVKFLGEKFIPFSIVFTKSDGLKKMELKTHIEKFNAAMLEDWHELPQTFITSATKKKGREALLDYIDQLVSS